jgi:hypothetical protein
MKDVKQHQKKMPRMKGRSRCESKTNSDKIWKKIIIVKDTKRDVPFGT